MRPQGRLKIPKPNSREVLQKVAYGQVGCKGEDDTTYLTNIAT